MIVSFHVTHSSAGPAEIASIIPILELCSGPMIEDTDLIDEYIILRTCNRFEIYAVTSAEDEVVSIFEELASKNTPYPKDSGVWYTMKDISSVRHLFRVTCGLDSMIVGEDQIQGQVRDAFVKAKKEGHVSHILSRLFERALYTGKRVRSETDLNTGAVSMGSAAVELAKKELGHLEGRTVGIVGAGDMGTVIAKYLTGVDLKAIFVSNRTFEHAKVLANQLGGEAVRYDLLSQTIGECDLILVATSAPHIILTREMVESAMAGRDRDLLIIDISVPRNVSPDISEIPNVKVDTMAEIGSVASENMMRRRNEINGAESIVMDEMNRLFDERNEHAADIVIGEIAKHASCIRAEELSTAMSRISGGSDPNEVLNDFSNALVAKLMAKPFCNLREASKNGHDYVCELAADLFGVEQK